MIQSED